MKQTMFFGIMSALFGALTSTANAEEVLPALSKEILAKFPKADRNGNGKIDAQEWTVVQKGVLRK